jgi:hypothetical protein
MDNLENADQRSLSLSKGPRAAFRHEASTSSAIVAA